QRYFGRTGYAALRIDLDVLERVSARRRSAERFLYRQLQVFGVKNSLALGEAQDEGVHRSKLMFLQLHAHRRKLLGQSPPPRSGAHLSELRRVPDVRRIDERGHHGFWAAWRTEDGGGEGR